jgi:hypothetical protein
MTGIKRRFPLPQYNGDEPPEITNLFGQPGAGKSTLMRYLLRDLPFTVHGRPPKDKVGTPYPVDESEPIPHVRYYTPGTKREELDAALRAGTPLPHPLVIEVGRPDPINGKSGTDRIHKAIQADLIAWLTEERPHQFVLMEGDRMSYYEFWLAMTAEMWRVNFIYLNTSDEEAERRRIRRGDTQDARWIKGRISKAKGLAELLNSVEGEMALDGALPLTTQEAWMSAFPSVNAIMEARVARAINRARIARTPPEVNPNELDGTGFSVPAILLEGKVAP